MSQRVACLHAVLSLAGQFQELTREILPGSVEVWHTVDEILVQVAVAQGGLSPFVYRRVAGHVRAAEEAGADAVQLTCSSISPCAEVAQALIKIPVLKVDDPMVDRALDTGRRIGVAATAATALAPVSALVRDRARACGKLVTVNAVLCVAEGLQPPPSVPLLTSPRLAVERLRQVLQVATSEASSSA